MFYVEQEFLLMLLDGCIAQKDIWVLHVLPLCVQQDFLLLLPDSCIARNDIWVLHVALLFSARCPFDVARCLHCLQGYLTPSCIIFLCHAKLFLCDTWLPQRSQFTFFSQIGAFSGAGNHQKCSISGTLKLQKGSTWFQGPKISKKVRFPAPEIAKNGQFQAPYNSKKAPPDFRGLKMPKRCVFRRRKLPKMVNLRHLITPKRLYLILGA